MKKKLLVSIPIAFLAIGIVVYYLFFYSVFDETYGGIRYRMNRYGHLVITGDGNHQEGLFSGTNSISISRDIKEKVKSARVDLKNVEDYSSMFADYKNIESIYFTKQSYQSMNKLNNMFYNCNMLKTINTSEWNVSSVSNFQWMFSYCINLEELDVSNWDVSGAENVSYMFLYCNKLKKLDVSNWDMSNVIYASGLFHYCQELETLSVENWNTHNMTNIDGMFSYCYWLHELDVSGWDVTNVINAGGCFSNTSLPYLDLSKWNTIKLEDLNHFVNYSIKLENIDMSGWDISHLTKCDDIFTDCRLLNKIDLSTWNFHSEFDYEGLIDSFNGLENLTEVLVNESWFEYCTIECDKVKLVE